MTPHDVHIAPKDPPTAPRPEVRYLDLWEQHLSLIATRGQKPAVAEAPDAGSQP